MGKPKTPHKKFPLKPLRREAYSPPPDKVEGTDIRTRGYFPGADFSPSQLAFIRGVDDHRRRSGRKFLSAVDHLRIVARLGWLRLPAGLACRHTGEAT